MLRQHEDRARCRIRLPDAPGSAKWALPVHRRVLQLLPLALGNRLHDANAKRATRSGRVGRDTCPPKRGKVISLMTMPCWWSMKPAIIPILRLVDRREPMSVLRET